jgi:hypothetical protein
MNTKKASAYIEKIKNTSAFVWSIRLLVIALFGTSAGLITYAKEVTGFLARDTVKEIVSDSLQAAKQEMGAQLDKVQKQQDNMIVLMMQAFPEFKQAAEEKAAREQNNETLLNAIKGDKQ